jgi:hypothetical protein
VKIISRQKSAVKIQKPTTSALEALFSETFMA